MKHEPAAVRTPEEYCNAYLLAVYGNGTISKLQTKEVSQAFYAGIEATCKFIHRYIAGHQGEIDDEILVQRLVDFRTRNRQRSLKLNQQQTTTTTKTKQI